MVAPRGEILRPALERSTMASPPTLRRSCSAPRSAAETLASRIPSAQPRTPTLLGLPEERCHLDRLLGLAGIALGTEAEDLEGQTVNLR